MSGKILIGGDVAPTAASGEAFAAGNADRLLQDGLAELWMAADARILNLECPLADRETPIEKCGAAMRAPLAAARGVAALRPTAVALSNNHILDQGEAGLSSTVAALASARIPCFGAGQHAKEADGVFCFVLDRKRVAVYAVCEHEYSVATESTPGANGFDPLEIADRLRAIKQDCDYLIVLYHGGREYDPYPSPLLQKRCRKMAEAGADLVLCQHSHCVGCRETYENAVIVYGQGNFLFDLDGEPAAFDTGLVVSVDLAGEKPAVAFLPVARKNHGAALLAGDAGAKVLAGFAARSEEIRQPGFVEARYRQYAGQMREKLLSVFLSGNPLLRGVKLLYGRRPTKVYSRQALLNIRNSLTCESILELITEGIR